MFGPDSARRNVELGKRPWEDLNVQKLPLLTQLCLLLLDKCACPLSLVSFALAHAHATTLVVFGVRAVSVREGASHPRARDGGLRSFHRVLRGGRLPDDLHELRGTRRARRGNNKNTRSNTPPPSSPSYLPTY